MTWYFSMHDVCHVTIIFVWSLWCVFVLKPHYLSLLCVFVSPKRKKRKKEMYVMLTKIKKVNMWWCNIVYSYTMCNLIFFFCWSFLIKNLIKIIFIFQHKWLMLLMSCVLHSYITIYVVLIYVFLFIYWGNTSSNLLKWSVDILGGKYDAPKYINK